MVVNREANSVSIIQVKNKNGNDVSNKVAEIPVGEEPRCVAVQPSNRAAYVTNAIGGIVSVVDLNLRGPSARLLAKEKLTFKAQSSASQSLNSGVGHPPVIETRPIISDGTAERAQSSSGVGTFATTGDFR